MATENRASWLTWITSCTWPLSIPTANFLRLRVIYRSAFAGDSRLQSWFAADAVNYLSVMVPLTLGLSLLTCWVISSRHRAASREAGVAFRAAQDVGLLLALAAGPWIAVSLMLRAPVRDFFGIWGHPGVLQRSIPSICAILAGVSFALMTSKRRSRHVHEAT